MMKNAASRTFRQARGGALDLWSLGLSKNFCCCFVDDGDIYIGDDTMIGPNCTLATSIHPVSPRLRKYKIQRNRQIHIGRNVWLGAGAIILSGVTVGDNSIVGAGSVVTKDVPANVIVVGNPALSPSVSCSRKCTASTAVAVAISQRAVVATAVSWLLLWGTSNLNVSSAISTTAVNCIAPKVNVFISPAKLQRIIRF